MPPKMKPNEWYQLEVRVTDGHGLPPGEVKAFLTELANQLACAENGMKVQIDKPDDYQPPGGGGVGAAAFSAVTAAGAPAADPAPADPAPAGDVVTEPAGAADAPTDEEPLPEPAPPPTAPAPAPAPGGGVQPMYFCHNKGV
jgi:hypothetical protein